MNKKQAKDEAIENKRTWGDLMGLIVRSPTTGTSRVNKSLSKAQAVDILKAAIEERNQNAFPKTMVWNRPMTHKVLGGDGLTVVNILRECA